MHRPTARTPRLSAKINLQILATVLTLISNPRATEIDYEIAVWAEEFLFHAQIETYAWLQRKSDSELPSVGVLRFEGDRITSLRSAIEVGGLLYEGEKVKARDLRDKYRSWRKLIEDLQAPGESNKQVRQTAEQILYQLGVIMEPHGKGFVFSMKPLKRGDDE